MCLYFFREMILLKGVLRESLFSGVYFCSLTPFYTLVSNFYPFCIYCHIHYADMFKFQFLHVSIRTLFIFISSILQGINKSFSLMFTVVVAAFWGLITWGQVLTVALNLCPQLLGQRFGKGT